MSGAHVKWLEEAARYFESRSTGGEDMAFWANVYNAENCRKIAGALLDQEAEIERLRAALSDARKMIQTRETVDEIGWGKGTSPATRLLAKIDAALPAKGEG